MLNRTISKIIHFYFPQSALPISFMHGVLGVAGAEIGMNFASAYSINSPFVVLLFIILGYLLIATIFAFVIKFSMELIK